MRKDQQQQRHMAVHHGVQYKRRQKKHTEDKRFSQCMKIKGFLNVFDVYDHTNDQMYTHCYKNKTGDQFLDFIKRVDRKYDSSVKQIFLVLDNASIHRSKKVRETIQKHHHRINFVFLPTRSPELNLIEVRWLWMHRDRL